MRSLQAYLGYLTFYARHFSAYRMEFILRVLSAPLLIVVTVAFWSALTPRDSEALAQYAAYFTVVIALSRLLNFTGVAKATQAAILSGTYTSYLVKPISPWSAVAANSTVQFAWTLGVLAPCVLLAVFIGWISPRPDELSLALVYVALGAILQFQLYALVGLLAFWTGEVRGFIALTSLALSLLAGQLVPPYLLPPWLWESVQWTFIPYLYYVPTALLVKPESVPNLSVALPLVYVGVLAVLIGGMRRLGELKYSAPGV